MSYGGAAALWFTVVPFGPAARVQWDGDMVHVPTVLGWRHLDLTRSRGRIVRVPSRAGATTETWILWDGWRVVVLEDPQHHRVPGPGVPARHRARTLGDHLRGRLGNRLPAPRHPLLAGFVVMLCYIGWIAVVGSLLLLVCAGRLTWA